MPNHVHTDLRWPLMTTENLTHTYSWNVQGGSEGDEDKESARPRMPDVQAFIHDTRMELTDREPPWAGEIPSSYKIVPR